MIKRRLERSPANVAEVSQALMKFRHSYPADVEDLLHWIMGAPTSWPCRESAAALLLSLYEAAEVKVPAYGTPDHGYDPIP